MDELTEVRLLRAEVPESPDLAAAEARFLAGMNERERRRRVPRPRGRLIMGMLATGLAGVAGIAAIVVDGKGDGARPGPARVPVAAFMDKVAGAAALEPIPRPRRTQYVYLEMQSMNPADTTGDKVPPWLHRERVKMWMSVSGLRPNLSRREQLPPLPLPGEKLPPEATKLNPPSGDMVTKPCGTRPPLQRPYLDGLPTDPERFLALLDEQGHEGSRGSRLWESAGDILMSSVASPPLRATMFRAIGRIPDVIFVPNSVDAAGRRGVAVARIEDGVRTEFIFDARTYRFLGQRGVIVDRDSGGGPVGSVVDSTAILKAGVVDNTPKPAQGADEADC